MSVSQLVDSTVVQDMVNEVKKELDVKAVSFESDRERHDAVQRAGRLFHCLIETDDAMTRAALQVLYYHDSQEFLSCVADVVDVYHGAMPHLFENNQISKYMYAKQLNWRV